MKDIKILGGGLSGLSAAINLAKAGYNVDVFEKRSDCGKRFHGDLEGLENWSSTVDVMHELRSMNIKINFDCNPFKTISITDGNEILKGTVKDPLFYIVRRGAVENSIDQGLKNQALDLGVNIHFNSKVSKEDMDIISIGPSENKYIGFVRGIGFETESDDMAVLLLNKEASTGGYSYLLVSNGHGCICSVNVIVYSNQANKYFKKTYDIFTKLVDIDIKNKKNVGGIGCFLLKPRYVENGKIYTGEAAGYQDLLWGFGMRYAMVSGYLAALSIKENKNYKKLIKKNFSDKLKTSVVNRFLTEKGGDYVYTYVFNEAKNNPPEKWTDMLYERFNPSLQSRVLYPFAKWYLSKRIREFHKNLLK